MQQTEEDADIAAISQFYDSFNASVQAGEGADGYVKFVSEDAVMMPPNELPVTGREAIRNWVAPILEQFVLSGDPVVQEMLVAGDLAYRRYTVSASLSQHAP